MSVLVGKKAPSFKAVAVINGSEVINEFSLDQYLGKKYVIFSFILPILPSFVQRNCSLFKRALVSLKREIVLWLDVR